MSKRVGIALCFALLALAFFAPVLFTDHFYLPVGEDFVNYNYPNDLFAARTLQNGEIPFWNPYIATGQPYAADPNIGFFYPFRLLLTTTLFNYQAMTWLIIGHYFLAGIFTYALARDLGATRWGSLVAGIGFMFSGFLIGQMDHINIVMSSVWLPVVFLFFRRAILQGRASYAVAAGLCLSLSILGGHQQFSLFIGYWCGLWLVLHLLEQRGRGFVRGSAFLLLLGGVALGGAAVQIILTVEFFQHTERTAMTLAQASVFSLQATDWFLLLSPHYLGVNFSQARPFWDHYVNVNESYMYAGIVVLFAAIVGSYTWKSSNKWFLGVIILLALLLSLGQLSPVFHLAFTWVPGMKWVRVPTRFALWIALSLPLLAGMGIDWLIAHLPTTNKPSSEQALWREIFMLLGMGIVAGIIVRLLYPVLPSLQVNPTHPLADLINQYRQQDAEMVVWLLGGVLVVLWGAYVQPRWRAWMPLLLVGLMVVDLFRAQQPRHITSEDTLSILQPTSIIAHWPQTPDFYRIDADYQKVITDAIYWGPLTGMVHGFVQAQGLSWNPFDLQMFQDYLAQIDPESRFYDFLGVRYLVTAVPDTLSGKWIPLPISSDTLALYENSQALPRAFMVYQSQIEADAQQTLALIRQNSFDPATTVLLTEGQPFSGTPGRSQVEITSMTANTLSLAVVTDAAGYLVVSDSYYPDWQVMVNGRSAELLRANYTFRAVFLPAGQFEVRFAYRPPTFVWGVGLTVATWLIAGGFILAAWWRSAGRPANN